MAEQDLQESTCLDPISFSSVARFVPAGSLPVYFAHTRHAVSWLYLTSLLSLHVSYQALPYDALLSAIHSVIDAIQPTCYLVDGLQHKNLFLAIAFSTLHPFHITKSRHSSRLSTCYLFPYSQPFKVYGVNLGGWFVLEPWITPSLFNDGQSKDEYTLSKALGGKAQSTLSDHWNSWITQADFDSISKAGLNHVRVPVGYCECCAELILRIPVADCLRQGLSSLWMAILTSPASSRY